MDIEIIGYLAGATVAVSLMPQVIKSWKTRSTKDISVPWMLIYLFGLILWVIYGVGISSLPMIITISIEALLVLSLLMLKLFYK